MTFMRRFWIYQSERIRIVLVASLTASMLLAVNAFSRQPSVARYLACVLIVMLYIVQIRLSDDLKDYEHDNRFYPERPVQKGVVSLGELRIALLSVIAMQLVLYALFLDYRIFALGLVTQGYALITRKEFFIEQWQEYNRGDGERRFHIYQIAHFSQLFILSFSILFILRPVGISYSTLVAYVLIHLLLIHIGRKVYAETDEVAGNSYSAELGYARVGIALGVTALLSTGLSAWLVSRGGYNPAGLIPAAIAVAAVFLIAVTYARRPTVLNATALRYSALLTYFVSTLSVAAGAYR